MGGYADKLQKKAAEVLRPDERLVAAVRTQPRGSTMGTAVGGVIGATVAHRQASKAQAGAEEGSLAAGWPKGNSAVGLTDQRLLLFNYTAMGKPKDLVGEVPLDRVASIDVEKKKVSRVVRFAFTDGSSVDVECARLEKVDDFVSAFQSGRTGG